MVSTSRILLRYLTNKKQFIWTFGSTCGYILAAEGIK